MLPGLHILRLFADSIRSDPLVRGVLCTLVPTLSIGFSILIGLASISLHLQPSLEELAFGVGLLNILVFPLGRRHTLHLGIPTKLGFFTGVMILMVPIIEFVSLSFLTNPPSPFPYATGWDIFSYLMLAGLVSAGRITTPLTTINPVTQQLPIPIGMPLLASYMFLPTSSHTASAVFLAKFGAIIPSTLGLAWTYLICLRFANRRRFALTGAIIAYSFTGPGIIDMKFLLPAGFAWAYCLFAVYALLFMTPSKTGKILFLVGSSVALFFHFYTVAAVVITLVFGTIASASLGRFSGTKQNLLRLYPLWGALVVFITDLSGYSFDFSGAGIGTTGLYAIPEKILLMSKSLTPLAWIVAVGVAFYFIIRHSSRHLPLHFLLVSILIYLLPISAVYRLLFWPGIFAAIITSKAASSVVAYCAETRSASRLRPSRVSMVTVCLLVILSAYPALIPTGNPSAFYITDGTNGAVQSSYSFPEYQAADFLSGNPPTARFLIFSDPGFSLVLGGLTGQDAVRLTSLDDMKPFQDQFLLLENSSLSQSTLGAIVKLIGQHYQLTSYGGLVIAFSARTYYWVKHYGYITYFPMGTNAVDTNMRSNLLGSSALKHLAEYQDVDILYIPLSSLPL